MIRNMTQLVLCLAAAVSTATSHAAYIETIHRFSADNNGVTPDSALTFTNGVLYGTTPIRYVNESLSSSGTVFRMNPDGSGFSTLHRFPGFQVAGPLGGVTVAGSQIWGTTAEGGDFGGGQIFTINNDGSGFATLHSFTGYNGASSPVDGFFPVGELTMIGSALYGTTVQGGTQNAGTIFTINADGSGYQVLHRFSGTDGASPHQGLTLVGSTLYGITSAGTDNSLGSIFAINQDGSGFHLLHTFTDPSGGYIAEGKLVSDGLHLFGTTTAGGLGGGGGTIFSIDLDGSNFRLLHSFAPGLGDGAAPEAGLTLVGSTLYGVTRQGGEFREGTLFSVDTSGEGYSILHSFSGAEGRNPQGELILVGSKLYGMTEEGGGPGYRGTVFAVAVPEPSGLVLSGSVAAVLAMTLAVRRLQQGRTSYCQ